MRSLAVSTDSCSISIRIELNPSFIAAIPVDPDPANGSNTVPPGGVINRQRYLINASGLTVGCAFFFSSFIWVAGSSNPIFRSALLAFAQ